MESVASPPSTTDRTTTKVALPPHINDAQYHEHLWDWTQLEGCFATPKIRPCDIDGAVEWKGHVLLLETKGPTAWMPYGQRAMYETLVAAGVTVAVVWGAPNKPNEILLMTQTENKHYPNATMQTLRNICRTWSLYANSHPKPLPAGFPRPYPTCLESRLKGNPPLV